MSELLRLKRLCDGIEDVHNLGSILRVAECSGNDIGGVEAMFLNPITEAYEVKGDETELCRIPVDDRKIRFDMKHNGIKSFALVFDKAEAKPDGENVLLF